jgi:hypothetical protein
MACQTGHRGSGMPEEPPAASCVIPLLLSFTRNAADARPIPPSPPLGMMGPLRRLSVPPTDTFPALPSQSGFQRAPMSLQPSMPAEPPLNYTVLSEVAHPSTRPTYRDCVLQVHYDHRNERDLAGGISVRVGSLGEGSRSIPKPLQLAVDQAAKVRVVLIIDSTTTRMPTALRYSACTQYPSSPGLTGAAGSLVSITSIPLRGTRLVRMHNSRPSFFVTRQRLLQPLPRLGWPGQCTKREWLRNQEWSRRLKCTGCTGPLVGCHPTYSHKLHACLVR